MRKGNWKKRTAALILAAGMAMSGISGTGYVFADETEAAEETVEEGRDAGISEPEKTEDVSITDAEQMTEAIEEASSWNGYTIDKIDESAKIVWLNLYTGTDKEITVPATANINGATYKVGITPRVSPIHRSIFNKKDLKVTSVKLEPGVILPADCNRLFEGCIYLKSIDMTGVDTSGVTNMSGMFSGCKRLESLQLGSGFTTENVTDMSYMFYGCESMADMDIKNWNTKKVENMQRMFSASDKPTYPAEKMLFSSMDLSGWETPNLKNAEGMFNDCNKLTQVDMRKFNLSGITDASLLNMFSGCTFLNEVISPKTISGAGDAALPDTFVNTPITVKVKGANKSVNYSFTALPGGSVKLRRGTADRAWLFSDVSANPDNWKYTGIVYCAENGIMAGDGEGGIIPIPTTFRPNAPLQRRDFAVMLYAMQGRPSVAGLQNPFKDVPAGSYYTDAVIWAYHNGIVNGRTETTFDPKADIMRREIAIMLKGYEDKFGKGNGNVTASIDGYADRASISEKYAGYLSWAVGMGIISGLESKDGNGQTVVRLGAKETATRAMCARMIMSYLEH